MGLRIPNGTRCQGHKLQAPRLACKREQPDSLTLLPRCCCRSTHCHTVMRQQTRDDPIDLESRRIQAVHPKRLCANDQKQSPGPTQLDTVTAAVTTKWCGAGWLEGCDAQRRFRGLGGRRASSKIPPPLHTALYHSKHCYNPPCP